jgi:hypothetical protein
MQGVDQSAVPTGTGCVECDASGGWWVHLRRCAQCGHIGCCDVAVAARQPARREFGPSGDQKFEPGEEWFFGYQDGAFYDSVSPGTARAPPVDQPVPGPAAGYQRTGKRIH